MLKPQQLRRLIHTTQTTNGRSAKGHIGFAVVPQQEQYIVERFGKYSGTRDAGLHLLVPIIDKIAYVQMLKEQAIKIHSQSAITSDNVNLHIDGVLYIQVVDAYKASYNVEDPEQAITQLAQTTMRAGIGNMTLDNVFRERQAINEKIVDQLNRASLEPWGIKCLRYEIKTIEPPENVKESMEMEMVAERKKRAEILESQAKKQAAINIADGEKESIIRIANAEAEAKKVLATAEAERIRIVGEAMKSAEGKEAVQFQIAEGYVKAYEKLAKESTTLLIPQNAGDVAGMVSTALGTYRGITKNPGIGTNVPSSEDVIRELESEISEFTPRN